MSFTRRVLRSRQGACARRGCGGVFLVQQCLQHPANSSACCGRPIPTTSAACRNSAMRSAAAWRGSASEITDTAVAATVPKCRQLSEQASANTRRTRTRKGETGGVVFTRSGIRPGGDPADACRAARAFAIFTIRCCTQPRASSGRFPCRSGTASLPPPLPSGDRLASISCRNPYWPGGAQPPTAELRLDGPPVAARRLR